MKTGSLNRNWCSLYIGLDLISIFVIHVDEKCDRRTRAASILIVRWKFRRFTTNEHGSSVIFISVPIRFTTSTAQKIGASAAKCPTGTRGASRRRLVGGVSIGVDGGAGNGARTRIDVDEDARHDAPVSLAGGHQQVIAGRRLQLTAEAWPRQLARTRERLNHSVDRGQTILKRVDPSDQLIHLQRAARHWLADVVVHVVPIQQPIKVIHLVLKSRISAAFFSNQICSSIVPKKPPGSATEFCWKWQLRVWRLSSRTRIVLKFYRSELVSIELFLSIGMADFMVFKRLTCNDSRGPKEPPVRRRGASLPSDGVGVRFRSACADAAPAAAAAPVASAADAPPAAPTGRRLAAPHRAGAGPQPPGTQKSFSALRAEISSTATPHSIVNREMLLEISIVIFSSFVGFS